MRLLPRRASWWKGPATQLGCAAAVMVLGAWLIAMWVVGLVLMVAGLLWTVDALLRDTPVTSAQSHEDVIERYRRVK